MKSKRSRVLATVLALTVVACILGGVGVSLRHAVARKRLMDARREDVEALVQVCLKTEKIATSEELFTAAARDKVKLHSPIPKDPSKPCYWLVRPWNSQGDSVTPSRIIIAETNITDKNLIFVATMDGSVFPVSRERLHANQR